MDNQARQILQQCIRDYGITLGREPQRLEALLKDYAKGQLKREIFVLVQATKENVVDQLLNNTAPLELIAGSLAHQLTENYGIDRPLAEWAIESWVFALNLSIQPIKAEPAILIPDNADSIEPDEVNKPPILIDGRFRDNEDGTATDLQTGLQWMRCSLGQTWDGTTCQGDADEYNWHEANKVVRDSIFLGFKIAEKFSFAGYDDWRVPTIDELKSIIEKNEVPPINVKVFPNTPLTLFWSSSPYADYTNFAWRLDFGNGHVKGSLKTYLAPVRLVRGGQ
ncbi:MAG: DUF1566 domain-containing protein [Methylomicrobium sp.]|nr:DUF1566 domain-containing protein [Methylomicrobium sp.]